MKILKWIKEKLKTESVEPYDYKRDMSNRCNRTHILFCILSDKFEER